MTEQQVSWLERLEEYADRYRDDFRRRDQARWAAVYLQGLLSDCERKTIGAMARQVVLPQDLEVEDIAQALQNFVNQSPWDEARPWRRYRAWMASALGAEAGFLVLDDLAFAKQGRHSVGVQRQYSASLGRKANCQVAVAVHQAGPAGAYPLALRLYLPRGWLASLSRLELASVPPERRRPQSKATIALDLLGELRAEAWPTRPIVAGPGFADIALRQALAERGLTYFLEVSPGTSPGPGEHLWAPRCDLGPHFLSNRAPDANGMADRFEAARAQVQAGRHLLMEKLGLNHFEGRSWRGFHHHACLVMLAHGFRLLESAGYPPSP
jgi:SRSO17 transposase